MLVCSLFLGFKFDFEGGPGGYPPLLGAIQMGFVLLAGVMEIAASLLRVWGKWGRGPQHGETQAPRELPRSSVPRRAPSTQPPSPPGAPGTQDPPRRSRSGRTRPPG